MSPLVDGTEIFRGKRVVENRLRKVCDRRKQRALKSLSINRTSRYSARVIVIAQDPRESIIVYNHCSRYPNVQLVPLPQFPFPLHYICLRRSRYRLFGLISHRGRAVSNGNLSCLSFFSYNIV